MKKIILSLFLMAVSFSASAFFQSAVYMTSDDGSIDKNGSGQWVIQNVHTNGYPAPKFFDNFWMKIEQDLDPSKFMQIRGYVDDKGTNSCSGPSDACDLIITKIYTSSALDKSGLPSTPSLKALAGVPAFTGDILIGSTQIDAIYNDGVELSIIKAKFASAIGQSNCVGTVGGLNNNTHLNAHSLVNPSAHPNVWQLNRSTGLIVPATEPLLHVTPSDGISAISNAAVHIINHYESGYTPTVEPFTGVVVEDNSFDHIIILPSCLGSTGFEAGGGAWAAPDGTLVDSYEADVDMAMRACADLGWSCSGGWVFAILGEQDSQNATRRNAYAAEFATFADHVRGFPYKGFDTMPIFAPSMTHYTRNNLYTGNGGAAMDAIQVNDVDDFTVGYQYIDTSDPVVTRWEQQWLHHTAIGYAQLGQALGKAAAEHDGFNIKRSGPLGIADTVATANGQISVNLDLTPIAGYEQPTNCYIRTNTTGHASNEAPVDTNIYTTNAPTDGNVYPHSISRSAGVAYDVSAYCETPDWVTHSPKIPITAGSGANPAPAQGSITHVGSSTTEGEVDLLVNLPAQTPLDPISNCTLYRDAEELSAGGSGALNINAQAWVSPTTLLGTAVPVTLALSESKYYRFQLTCDNGVVASGSPTSSAIAGAFQAVPTPPVTAGPLAPTLLDQNTSTTDNSILITGTLSVQSNPTLDDCNVHVAPDGTGSAPAGFSSPVWGSPVGSDAVTHEFSTLSDGTTALVGGTDYEVWISCTNAFGGSTTTYSTMRTLTATTVGATNYPTIHNLDSYANAGSLILHVQSNDGLTCDDSVTSNTGACDNLERITKWEAPAGAPSSLGWLEDFYNGGELPEYLSVGTGTGAHAGVMSGEDVDIPNQYSQSLSYTLDGTANAWNVGSTVLYDDTGFSRFVKLNSSVSVPSGNLLSFNGSYDVLWFASLGRLCAGGSSGVETLCTPSNIAWPTDDSLIITTAHNGATAADGSARSQLVVWDVSGASDTVGGACDGITAGTKTVPRVLCTNAQGGYWGWEGAGNNYRMDTTTGTVRANVGINLNGYNPNYTLQPQYLCTDCEYEAAVFKTDGAEEIITTMGAVSVYPTGIPAQLINIVTEMSQND